MADMPATSIDAGERLSRIGRFLGAERNDLALGLGYVSNDPDAAAIKARRAVETLLRESFRFELGEPPHNAGLQKLFDQLKSRLPRPTVASVELVQRIGNLAAHPSKPDDLVTEAHARTALDAALAVAEWFVQQYVVQTPPGFRPLRPNVSDAARSAAIPSLANPAAWAKVYPERARGARCVLVQGHAVHGVIIDFIVGFVHDPQGGNTTGGVSTIDAELVIILESSLRPERFQYAVGIAHWLCGMEGGSDSARSLGPYAISEAVRAALRMPRGVPLGWLATIYLGQRAEYTDAFRQARQELRTQTRGKVSIASFERIMLVRQ